MAEKLKKWKIFLESFSVVSQNGIRDIRNRNS
jgi:hypothetical protein